MREEPGSRTRPRTARESASPARSGLRLPVGLEGMAFSCRLRFDSSTDEGAARNVTPQPVVACARTRLGRSYAVAVAPLARYLEIG